MKKEDLLACIALGEDIIRQFKANVKNSDALASEMLLRTGSRMTGWRRR
jgi:hypothetical protein